MFTILLQLLPFMSLVNILYTNINELECVSMRHLRICTIILTTLFTLFSFVCCKGGGHSSEASSFARNEWWKTFSEKSSLPWASERSSIMVSSWQSNEESSKESSTVSEMDNDERRAYEFLEALKSKDVKKLCGMAGVISEEAYDFFKNTDVESYEMGRGVSYKYGKIFEVTLNITKSSHELFPVGESKWILDSSGSSSGDVLFQPKGVELKRLLGGNYEFSDVVSFCENFSATFYCFGTYTDFKEICNEYREDKALDILTEGLIHFMPMDKGLDVSFGLPRKWFEEKAEKVLGITGVDFTKSQFYNAEKDAIVHDDHGGSWNYCTLVSEEYDEESKLHTVVLDFYADVSYLVKAKTVKYIVKENEDGSFRLLSTENLFDSGYEAARGSI